MAADPRFTRGALVEDPRYAWLGTGWQFLPQIAYKSADQTVSSTSLADDTHLKLPVQASAGYLFEFFYFVTAAATTTGVALSVNGPTIGAGTIQFALSSPLTYGGSGAAGTISVQGATAYNSILIGATVPSTSVPSLHLLTGTFFVGATAGLLQGRIAGEAAANITYRKGSLLRLTRLPL